MKIELKKNRKGFLLLKFLLFLQIILKKCCYMPISLADQRYIDNKHRGGVSNSKGNAYESYYAIYKISDLLLSHDGHLQDIIVESQVYAAIDDLYVKEISQITYYQIKNVHNLSWNYGSNGHTLRYDCILQNELSKEKSEQFKIVIVYSDRKSSLIPLPVEISSYTNIDFFPPCDSVNQLLLSFKPFQESIKNICSIDNPKNDDLLNIAQVLLGIWCSNPSAINLNDFYNEVLKYDSLPIKGFQKEFISEECKSLFDDYQIVYRIIDNKLFWHYKNHQLKGTIVWNKQKDDSLVNSRIKNFWDLIKLLN